jgi:lipoate-protein ligase A
MAVDEALLLHTPRMGPSVRLYGWSAPTVSLGLRQRGEEWLPRCEAMGVAIVRRASGGGAVLHAGDLTYAVVAPRDCPDIPPDLGGSCEWIRSVLLDGLTRAGLPVSPACSAAGAARAEACFAGSLGYEIEVAGRKLVGSAQRRTPFGFLQHGSIRLREPGGLSRALFGAAVPPAPPLPEGCTSERVSRALAEAFRTALEGRLPPGELDAEELETADSYERERRGCGLWSPPGFSRRHQRIADRVA